MLKVLSFLLIFFCVSIQVSAQCGVYFKETNRQVFSNSFTNGYFEDFDNDGLQDLFGYSINEILGSSRMNVQVHYYKRLGQNSFDTTAKSTLITNVGTYFGVVGDVNGDGKKDLIISQRTNPLSLITYLNDGTGRFSTTTPTTPVTASFETIWAAGDLNNDGKADILTQTGNTLNYRLTQPDNSFSAPVSLATISGSGGLQPATKMDIFSAPVLIEDLNNDGANDIAFFTGFSAYSGILHVLTNNGSLSFSETYSGDFFHPAMKLRTFDLNNDGKKDFVSNAVNCCGHIVITVNNGNNTFTSSTMPISPADDYNSSQTKDVRVADFDNDGDVDIIYPSTRKYTVFRNQGNTTFAREEFSSLLNIDTLANLDGDGKADAVSLVRPFLDSAYRLYDGFNYYYYGLNNAVAFRKNVCAPVGQTKIVDFDGDGITDRAFWNQANGNWRYYSDPYGQSQVTFQWGAGALGDVPVPNDYDGDGQTDYAVFRKSNGTWWVYRSSDQQVYALSFGTNEDKPVPADYDGDGKADIAVYRPSTGDWHFWLSQTNQYTALHFGVAEDRPVPADYDGDGRADITVFRPSTGVWYRINSSNNSVFIFQYGLGTDKLVPGDYDGDGRANIAVFRDGVWYVLKNDFSTAYLFFGVANDIPYLDDAAVIPFIGVYRKTSSLIYLGYSGNIFGGAASYPTGNSSNEILISSILPPE